MLYILNTVYKKVYFLLIMFLIVLILIYMSVLFACMSVCVAHVLARRHHIPGIGVMNDCKPMCG